MICFDMDGVLVIYEWDAYLGENPKYLQPGYYRTCKPDEVAIRLIEYCMKMLPLDTFIATGVDPRCRNGMVLDKLWWIDKYIPDFDIGTKFVANSLMDKSALFEQLRMSGLNRHDVLIDDYNPRLYNWEMRGGTAIKYLNGINSADSWRGVSIDARNNVLPADAMFLKIMEAMVCK